MRPKRFYRYVGNRIIWEPRDLWVGLYWTPADRTVMSTHDGEGELITTLYHFYICLIPCLPLRISFEVIKRVFG